MSNIKFGSKVIVRTAGKSYEHFNYDNLKFELKDPNFQIALFFASESLFQELKKNNFIFEKLPAKVIFSLKKYYNRWHFRATPFALFASTGLAPWVDRADSTPAIMSGEVSILPDFQILLEMCNLSSSGSQMSYFPNRTIYGIKSDYRYLHYDISRDRESPMFKIFSFQKSSLLKRVLNYAAPGKNKQDIIEYCVNLGQLYEDSRDFIEYLISSGLLYSELLPNYVGHSYFHRLTNAIAHTGLKFKKGFNWDALKHLYRNYQAGEILQLKELCEIVWPEPVKSIKNKFYVNSFSAIGSGLNNSYQKNIMDGLRCLDILTPYKTIPALVDFVKRFKKKFEGREIPLLQALDPEWGIGYLFLEQDVDRNVILEGLDFKNKNEPETINWLPVHKLLLKKLQASKSFQPICLEDKDFEDIPIEENKKYPPSFIAHFTVHDDFISMEHVGGCSATALTGRFTLNNKEIRLYNRQIAKTEQELNTNVLFAEVSCLMSDQVANVCTRESTYAYEIPLLVHSTADSSYIIPPTDLYVSVLNDEIILKSKKLKKVIIPRFTSAYNYNRHNLAIFRFLCDLQYQSVKTDFNFNLPKIFPGLDFYPRVTYRSCLLQRATWILSKEQINAIIKDKNQVIACTELFDELHVPKFFIVNEHDNTLLFNRDVPENIDVFMQIIRVKDAITIKEALISKTSVTVDHKNAPLIHEFVAPIFNTRPSYEQHGTLNKLSTNKVKRDFIPADEWLFYKIYCHFQVGDEVLGNDIYMIIKALMKKDLIEQWFFIRHRDPDDHIRLRLKVKSENINMVMRLISKASSKRINNGSISAIMLDTYKKEIDRYGQKDMEAIEHVFNRSSSFVIHFLHRKHRNKNSFNVFGAIMVSLDAMIDQYDTNTRTKQEFTALMYQQFSAEFSQDDGLKYQLSSKYRQTRSEIEQCMKPRNRKTAFLRSGGDYFMLIGELLAEKSHNAKVRLLADIIHMHINRMFSEEQRKQEYVIYYLLSRYYRSIYERNKAH